MSDPTAMNDPEFNQVQHEEMDMTPSPVNVMDEEEVK